MAKENLTPCDHENMKSIALQFHLNLKHLKHIIITWVAQRRYRTHQELSHTESSFEDLHSQVLACYIDAENTNIFTDLEVRKSKVLEEMEIMWHNKSLAIWLKHRDENNFFFTTL